MKSIGFGKQVEDVEAGKCPFCGKIVDVAEFKDELSRREWEISGLCAACQKEMFG